MKEKKEKNVLSFLTLSLKFTKKEEEVVEPKGIFENLLSAARRFSPFAKKEKKISSSSSSSPACSCLESSSPSSPSPSSSSSSCPELLTKKERSKSCCPPSPSHDNASYEEECFYLGWNSEFSLCEKCNFSFSFFFIFFLIKFKI